MTVPAPGRTPAHPLVQLLGSLPHACLSWLQPLGVFLSPSSLQMPASASPGYICPSEASSLRYWIPWDGDSFQKLPVRVPAGRKWNHFPCLGSHPRRLHRHSRQASATMHQGLHYGSGMKTWPGAPACGAGGCAWPRPRSVSSRPPDQEAPRQTGATPHAQLLACSPEAAKRKTKAGVPRARNVETHFQPEAGRVT